MTAADPLLRIEDVSRAFGGVYAVRDVSLSVAEGETRAVIGPNGAGKSTLFNMISGHLTADHGTVHYTPATDGGVGLPQRIDRFSAHRRARLGIAIVFQGARLFHRMTALENVMVGAHARTRHGFLSAALRLPGHHREEAAITADALAALERVGLKDWAHRSADVLPLGQQRALQVARALCARPRLLLLDEPASGLRAGEREALAQLIESLRQEGLTMMLIEHDVAFVTRLADRITVLDLGREIAEGTPREIRDNEAVLAAYLGQESAA
ncbi:ABC transporter ATP-binding protein [Streptomyces sp. TRM66268-LWL]|uniref:ABC transporter ATP-binding protein n=1 Tax=Streptomyces polyasparticus TaxID=2767826 RepID=A0ABR7STG7_9ACTN|nr:ABC transporter ATP-binding protein [Streptomyces polyasparticus]MBC9718774.1 ABC transporter ATP-binding protein [Streptomyces polyasparticus]